MKYLLFVIISVTIFAIPLIQYGTVQSSKELYHIIKKEYQKRFPKDFVANVSGNEIERSVQKIPKDSYCKGKLPRVTYLFLKGEEESIIVENVENPFVTRFQTHLEVYKSAKSFLDTGKSYSDLKKTYYWEFVSSLSQDFYVVKMRKHRLRESDYLLLFFDKEEFSLVKATQYSNKKPIGHVIITYKKEKGYLLPLQLKFDITKKGKRKSFTLNISNYQLNTGLTSDKIIELQDDCPSL